MKSTERFSDRVADYVRYRPRYPDGVLDVLRDVAGLTPDWLIADIGAGTGFSAEPFLDNANRVCCVEPNREMRAAAETLLGERPGFRSVAGTAEATTLEPGSIDMVVVAQAFHWLDPSASRREFVRILRPRGWVTVMWNTRRTEVSPFLEAYEQLIVLHGTDYAAVRHDRAARPALDRFFAGAYTSRSLPHAQVLDLAGLKGRVLSSSYTPPADDPRRALLLRDVESVFAEHQRAGHVEIDYLTELHVGRLAA
jgi:SAM-dependent methyltransferase